MARGYLIVIEPFTRGDLYVRVLGGPCFGSIGIYGDLDFGLMVALRCTGRLATRVSLEVQVGTFLAEVSLGPIPSEEVISLLVGPARRRKG